MALNFNRFTYRRKPSLDFLSSNKNDDKGSSQDRGCATQRNVFEKGGKNEMKTASEGFASSRPKRPTLVAPVSDDAAQRNSLKSNFNQQNKAASSRTESDFEKTELHQRSREKYYTSKENKTISAEEKLRNLLSSGPQCSSFESNEKSNKVKEERQEIMNNEIKSIGTHCNKSADTKKKSLLAIEQRESSIDDYQSFKQRGKRKRRVILSDDDEDDDDEHSADQKISTIDQPFKRERYDEKQPMEGEESQCETTDIDKLREIYSHLTIDQAKEAIELAGNLMDAILNLSETLFTEGSILILY